MTTLQKTELDELVGTTILYRGEKYKVENYKQLTTGNIVVYTNRQTLNFLPDEISKFLDEVEILQDTKEHWTPAPTNSKTEVVVQLPQENQPLKNTLLDILKDIKESPTPENLKKAESICNISNTIINIQKTEIQMFKMQQKMNK